MSVVPPPAVMLASGARKSEEQLSPGPLAVRLKPWFRLPIEQLTTAGKCAWCFGGPPPR